MNIQRENKASFNSLLSLAEVKANVETIYNEAIIRWTS